MDRFALASHPKVFAAHGHFAIDSVVTKKFAQEDDTGSLSVGNVARALYESNDLDKIFATYRSRHPGAEVYGNIHSFTLDSLPNVLKKSARASRFAVVNVVRHPVSFIDGHCAVVRKAEGYPHLYRTYEANLFMRTLTDFHKLLLMDCTDVCDFLAFAGSCYSALIVAQDLRHEGFMHYRMESLIRNGTALAEFCGQLTGLDYSREKLDALIAGGAINRHRASSASRDEQEIYDGWPSWKKDIASVILSEKALTKFEVVGYDVDMLRAHVSQPSSGRALTEAAQNAMTFQEMP